MQDFAANLAGCTIFSKIDLVKGYHQVPMAAADIPKTAIITPFGMFEYVYMPFGLCNAAQTFQRMMDVIMQGLPHTFVYLDDCLVASRNMEDHILHLGQVMDRLQTAGLRVNFKKCVFAVGGLQFLGHSVSRAGMSPVSDNVAAVRNFPPPSDIKQLQRFLGMINFYRRFMPQAARVLKPLTDALAGCPKTLRPSVIRGFVGLAFQTPSLLTGGRSSRQQSGPPSVPSWVQITRLQPLTTRRATEWWKDGTAD